MEEMTFLLSNYCFSFFFLLPHLQQMEVLGLGVESELQLQAYATAIPDLSHVCNPYCSLQQSQTLNPLKEARDGSCVPKDTMLGS